MITLGVWRQGGDEGAVEQINSLKGNRKDKGRCKVVMAGKQKTKKYKKSIIECWGDGETCP